MAQQNALQNEIAGLLENKQVTQAYISRDTEISTATISQWLGGKYPGDVKTVEAKLAAWLERFKMSQNKPSKRFPFQMTSITKRVFEAAKICQLHGMLGLCVGPSGVGKTRSIEQYAEQNPGVILIKAHARYSTRDVFRDIHAACGFDRRGNVHSMMNDIVEKLKNTQRLIIVDESEHLNPNTLDEIRQINDRADVGVLYVGLDKFRSQLRTLRGDYDYIVNRVRVPAKVENLTPNDTEALVKSLMPSANGICATYHQAANGNARVLEMLIFNTMRVAEINKVEISKDLILQTAKALTV